MERISIQDKRQAQRSAKARLILARRRCIRLDLDPYEIEVDDDNKGKKLDAQLRILTWAGFSLVVAPYAYYGLKFLAACWQVPYDFPESEFNKFEFVNLGAVIAYGFSSGVHAWVNHRREATLNALQTGIQTVQDLSLSLPPHQLSAEERHRIETGEAEGGG